MKTKLFFATSLLLTAVAVSGGNRGTTPLTLRFNLPNGAKFAASTTMNMSMMVMQKDQGMNAVMSQAISVSKVGNGFKAVMKTVKAKFSAPAGSLMAAQTKTMEDAAKKVVTTTIFDAMGHSQTTTTGSQMAGGMSTGFMGMEYPAKGLNVGDKWTSTVDVAKILGESLKQLGTASGKPLLMTYTLKQVSVVNGKRIATIASTLVGSATITMKAQNMKMLIGMSGSGSSKVDTSTGMPMMNSMNLVMDMNVAGQQMKQTIKTSTTIK